MKTIFYCILIFLAIEFPAYLLAAYANFDLNPKRWDSVDRTFSAVLSGIIGLFAVSTFLNYKNKS